MSQRSSGCLEILHGYKFPLNPQIHLNQSISSSRKLKYASNQTPKRLRFASSNLIGLSKWGRLKNSRASRGPFFILGKKGPAEFRGRGRGRKQSDSLGREGMKELLGSPGTVCGLLLRIGQCVFAAGSIGVMVSAYGFSNYTAFCYLIASMGLQVLWSFGLACLDVYALRIRRDLQNPVLVSLFVVGDWVTATLSLGAACSSAGIAVLYAKDLKLCQGQMQVACGRFELSIILAFITWCLIAISSHVMFWILAAV